MDPSQEPPHPAYAFIAQEQGIFCVPAVTQMVLRRRAISYDPQQRIFAELGSHIEVPGTIDTYFRQKGYPLHCTDFLFNHSYGRDFDLLAKEALRLGCDIIVAYANGVLHKTSSKSTHASLLIDVHGTADHGLEATLIDPLRPPDGMVRAPFDEVVRAVWAVEEGFHIIHPDREVLERVDKEFP